MTDRLKCVKCGKDKMMHKLRVYDQEFNELYMRCRCGEQYKMPYLVPRMAKPKRTEAEYNPEGEAFVIQDDPLWNAVPKDGKVPRFFGVTG